MLAAFGWSPFKWNRSMLQETRYTLPIWRKYNNNYVCYDMDDLHFIASERLQAH